MATVLKTVRPRKGLVGSNPTLSAIRQNSPMKKRIVVHDKMQKNYSYFLVAPVGKNFHPDFRPELSPREMLELGVFGGKYLTDCEKEFPKNWFARAKLNSQFHDPEN